MLKKTLTTCLCGLAVALGSSAQTTLASWTFETGYDVTVIDDTHSLYTPNGGDAADVTGWSATQTPYILPESAEGDASAYRLAGYSEGRYWQLCGGYNTRVFRLANDNTAENPSDDYTNPANHKVYYEVSFPSKGYKGISLTYAIAPGNNTETPVEVVVSTDGGSTWFDAGTSGSSTSSTWFTYVDKTVTLSVNDKENVLVRLLPTTGMTNWNMRNLTISAAEKVAEPLKAENLDFSMTWKMDLAKDNPSGGVCSTDGLMSYAEMSMGSGFTFDGFSGNPQTIGDKIQTKIAPTVNNASSATDDAAFRYAFKPKKGLKFAPKTISFNATRYGTGGGKIDVTVEVNGEKTTILSTADIQRNNFTPPYSEYTVDFPAGISTGDEVAVSIHVYSLATNKQIGIGDVVVGGVMNGEVEPVPTYTFSLKSDTEGAGALSCSPAGNEFDEGTQITIASNDNFGYHFASWVDEAGNVVSTANPYTFELMGNTSLTAKYVKNNVYALNLAIEGGANINQVLYTPAGNVVDGVHYYEEGTDVQLEAVSNRILTFQSWEDGTTEPKRTIRMAGDTDVTANFSAADYIVGWDFYFDQPNSERAADYKAESDNAGLLSLHNPSGTTTSWLTRGVGNGAENGRWGARVWKLRSDLNYFEITFRSLGYSNLMLAASLGVSYNTYSEFYVQYSIDGGETYKTFGTYQLKSGWTDGENALPADASNQASVKIRFMPNYESELVGNATDYDGLCIADVYVLADRDSANDDVAPVLVSSIPANGAEGASATGSIILTFDEKVKIASGDAKLNGTVLAPIASGKSVVYKYAGLDYATTYTFTVPAGAIVDRSGNGCEAITLKFTTMERKQPEARLYDAIVAADGSGDYTSVQAAIDAAPENRVAPWLIFVKNGKYNEHVNIPASKPMIHLIGQDRDKAVILDDKLCGGDNALHVSVGATVVVNSNDCFFENITLENSYGHEKQSGPQALALNTIGDRVIFNNVAMLSYQDTWITSSNSAYRAYVRNSLIEGAVDFIYNSGDLYVDNTILLINRQSGGFIVAPSHADDVKWGYVFNNCTITAEGDPTQTTVWLGRPWHNSPKTVFLNTRAEVNIPATGWYETMGGLPALWADWNTTDINGNPADLSQRRDTYYKTVDGEKVYGKAKNHLTDEEAAEYTVKNVLSGSDNWEPVIKTESCAAPVVLLKDNVLTWDAVPYAICYVITKGDEVVGFTTESTYAVEATGSRAADETPYTVQAVNEFGGLSAKGVAGDGSQTAIDNIIAGSNEAVSVEVYDMRGIRLSAPAMGVNIVRTIDAAGNVKVEKIIVK